MLELCLPGGPASSLSTGTAVPRLSRSVSKDTGLDAGEAAMMRRQLAALQEEVVRLKPLEAQLGESEKARAQAEKQLKDMVPKGHRRNRGKGNKGEVGDALKVTLIPTRGRIMLTLTRGRITLILTPNPGRITLTLTQVEYS